nr:MAG: ASCH domain protein [Bacteriophage sp.]
MAIKPILFNAEMVRAILDGRKTCTRRVIKPQPQSRLCYTYAGSHNDCIGKWTYPNRGAHKLWGEEYKLPENIKDEELSKRWNPPYHTDDILYVRETWSEGYEDGTYIYRADDKLADLPTFKESSKLIYHPSIHMPKEAARIWLKVTDVRVERLQDMWASDVSKEGLLFNKPTTVDEMLLAFAKLWNSTIKKSDIDSYGWNANPWVWVIEFERREKPEGEF